MSRHCLAALVMLLVVSTAFAADRREMGLLPEAPDTGDLLGFDNPGDVPAVPAKGELVIQKLQPADCRHVLGFVHAPVDGRIDTWGYNGVVNEYDDSQNYGGNHWQMVGYEFIKQPAIHVTFTDDSGFNYVYLRGGYLGSIHRDVDAIDGPGDGRLVTEITACTGVGGKNWLKLQRVAFPEVVATRRVSFFRKDNLLSDAAFFRIGPAAKAKTYKDSLDFAAGAAFTDLAPLGLDFIQLPAAKPEDQHPSNFHRRYFRAGDRIVHDLAAGTAGQPITLAASQQIHFMTPPLADHLPVGALRVDLTLAGLSEGDIVSLAVQDPVIGNEELLRIDVRAAAGGKVKALLDFTDQIMPSKGRLWITLAAQKAAALDPASTFTVLTVDDATARPEHIAWRLLMLKGYFYVLSEARPFTDQKWDIKWLLEYPGTEWYIHRLRPQLLDLYRTIAHFREIAPDHPIAIAQYDRWINRGWEGEMLNFDAAELPDIPGVPRWATLLSKAAETTVAIPQWWATHRMSPDGELGGSLQDDTDFYQWWIPSALLDSEGFGTMAREKFASVAELLLRQNLRDGINIRTMDPLHAYEEGQNHMALMPLLFYGDPYYVEHLMTAVRSVDKWLYTTDTGGIDFQVGEFGWDTANPTPDKPITKVSGASSKAALLLHSHLMLAWYNHNPHAIDVLKRHSDSQGGWVEGAFGAGPHINFAAYWFTGDPKYLALTPDGKQGKNPWARSLPMFMVHGKEAHQQPWWTAYTEARAYEFYRGDCVWAAYPQRPFLQKALVWDMYGNPSSAGGGMVKFKYMWTEAEPFTDRIFLAVKTTAQAMLGGYNVRNSIWPAYAVSYENLGGDFAALVIAQGKQQLKIAMINLRDKPRAGSFRPWQLEHGRYELTIGPDANDDGEPDSVTSTQTLELAHMDKINVQLPSRQVVIYDLKQIEKLDDVYARADLAISSRDMVREGDTLTVTVHNIGSTAAKGAVVALVDSAGKTLATSDPITLDAPLDLIPRTMQARLQWHKQGAAVVVDPSGLIPELTELNNRVPVPNP